MKLLLAIAFVGLLHLVIAKDSHSTPPSTLNTADSDLQDDIGEEEFEEFFGLPPVTDPKEKARREGTLKANEASIKAQNEKYEAGNSTWFEAINELTNLSEDEIKTQLDGTVEPGTNRAFGEFNMQF